MVDFPTSVFDLADFVESETLDQAHGSFGHVQSHNAFVDEIAAAQTKLGTGASTPDANEVLVGNGTGTSTWLAGLTSAYLAANAVTQLASTASFNGTRTVASYADVDSTNGKIDLTTTGGDLIVLFFGSAVNTSAPVIQSVALRLDSGSEVSVVPVYSYNGLATYPVPFCIAAHFTGVSAAAHSVRARHINSSAVGTMTTTGFMIGMEIRR